MKNFSHKNLIEKLAQLVGVDLKQNQGFTIEVRDNRVSVKEARIAPYDGDESTSPYCLICGSKNVTSYFLGLEKVYCCNSDHCWGGK